MIFQRLIWSALGIALLAGSLQTAVQEWQAVPIILAAERYEDQKAEPLAAPALQASEVHAHAGADAHAHAQADDAAPEWAPEDGLERTGWTWVANVMYAFSMALLVLAVMGASLWRGSAMASLPMALLVAAAGWLSLDFWPSLGLHAEIPGMDAALLGSRQGWWVLAAGSAALACVSLAWLRTPWRWLASVLWLALPFVVGAPHITADPLAGFGAEAQTVLRQLGHDFVWATRWVAVSFWLFLGGLSGLAFQRWLRPVLVGALSVNTPSGNAMKANT